MNCVIMDGLVKKIVSSSGLDEEEVKNKVKEKMEEFSGLVSEEGAIHIVAKDLGVELLKKPNRLNIESIVPGMKNIDILGRITSISPVKEFKTDKAFGRLQNIVLGDLTGTIRMTLWNDEITKFKLKEDDVARVKGFVREDNLGNLQISLGKFGSIIKTSEEVAPLGEIPMERKIEKAAIRDLREGHYKEVRAALIQIFQSNPFYEICSVCSLRIKEGKCEQHSDAEPNYGLVVSGIIDDNTESIRAVFFNKNAETILNMKKDDARKNFEMKKDLDVIYKNIDLGEEFIFEGKVRRNQFFDRLEIIVNSVKGVDVKKEIEIMLN
jgi:ssDNA-binding replication factor A large subunit